MHQPALRAAMRALGVAPPFLWSRSAWAVPRGAEEAARAASTAPLWGFTCTDVLNASSAFVALRRGLVAVFGGACAPSVSDSWSHDQGVFVALGVVDGSDVEPTSGSHLATR